MAQDTYKSKHLITVSEGETMAILEGSIAAGRHDAREIAKRECIWKEGDTNDDLKNT